MGIFDTFHELMSEHGKQYAFLYEKGTKDGADELASIMHYFITFITTEQPV